MVKPIRMRLSRAPGFNLQAASQAANGLPARSVARPGPFGNPWTVAGAREAGIRGTEAGLRALCVARFRTGEAGGRPALNGLQARLPELRGFNLACWCPLPAPGEPDCCHAATLLEIANAGPEPIITPRALRCDAPGCRDEAVIRHAGEQYCHPHALEGSEAARAGSSPISEREALEIYERHATAARLRGDSGFAEALERDAARIRARIQGGRDE